MKIVCKKAEKKRIIQAISNGIICPFTDTINLGLDCPIYKADNCEECLEKNVIWHIEEGEQECH